ncbi:ABC transporter substrate-binding protein [Rhodoferax fermentans]|uniref:Iron ABC transporter substrate-binding protein n=1 Tax=Rhodoferax fermentans TaxID=28066 RepID=A0A1T1AUP4_RHOFE|nr:ABC transporter substrate-binding protein [Rhodoferax fermentans]MBK1683000.1 iron ABC transporter substrate-binding protein [Rhodoferax fermentans]OOV07836.1 iron ABC transporter substrate-binding protein [Rhodoferax fermentans]
MRFATTARWLCILGLTVGLIQTVQAAPEVIKDVIGRSVRVDLPAKRVLLGFYIEDYFAVGGDKAFDRLVGLSRGWFVKSRPAVWAQYVAARPTLRDVPDVGNVQDQSFSLEKALATKPDVVILADWQFKALASEVPRLEAAGIPVVVVDYNAQTLERHLASTKVLGQLTGETARAQRIADEYRQVVETIQQRIAKAKLPRPRVYIELGDKGPAEHSYTYGKNMWGAMVDLVGGDNVAVPFVKDWGPINPEQLLVTRPQVVFIAGYESVSSPDAMQMGVGVPAGEARRRLQGFAQRKGWVDLPALQEARLYGVYHGATRSLLDAAQLQYLAKALYPTLFTDIHPEATYQDFYRHYLPIQPQGTFVLSWK